MGGDGGEGVWESCEAARVMAVKDIDGDGEGDCLRGRFRTSWSLDDGAVVE